MRKIMLVFALIACSLLNAQDFQLSYGNAPFIELASPVTPLDWPFDWDDENSTIPFGFSFPIGELAYDSLVLSSNGWAITSDDVHEFNAYYVDLVAAGDETSVGYKTENVNGENVLKIEFLNAGFFEDVTSTARTSFQLWFYESGCWESRIGPSAIVDTFIIFEQYPGPFIGYANYSNDSVLAVVGPSDNPNLLAIDSIAFPTVNDVPVDGMYYSFCIDEAASTEQIAQDNTVRAYPNPASAHFYFESPDSGNWELINSLGVRVLSGFKTHAIERIEVADLPPGIYIATLNSRYSIRMIIE